MATVAVYVSESFTTLIHVLHVRGNYKQDHLLISGCVVPAHKCQPPLPSARQHPSYGDCLEVKREYYQNCSVLGCVTQCSQSAAHSFEQFSQVRQIGFVTLGPLCHA